MPNAHHSQVATLVDKPLRRPIHCNAPLAVHSEADFRARSPGVPEPGHFHASSIQHHRSLPTPASGTALDSGAILVHLIIGPLDRVPIGAGRSVGALVAAGCVYL